MALWLADQLMLSASWSSCQGMWNRYIALATCEMDSTVLFFRLLYDAKPLWRSVYVFVCVLASLQLKASGNSYYPPTIKVL